MMGDAIERQRAMAARMKEKQEQKQQTEKSEAQRQQAIERQQRLAAGIQERKKQRAQEEAERVRLSAVPPPTLEGFVQRQLDNGAYQRNRDANVMASADPPSPLPTRRRPRPRPSAVGRCREPMAMAASGGRRTRLPAAISPYEWTGGNKAREKGVQEE